MFYIGLTRRNDRNVIKVRPEPFKGAIAFNERSARVAVRRFIRGNLAVALVCSDDGMNTPADASDKKYSRALNRHLMLRGNGVDGYVVDYGPDPAPPAPAPPRYTAQNPKRAALTS